MKKIGFVGVCINVLAVSCSWEVCECSHCRVSMTQEIAPDFALTDIDGNAFSLSDCRGKVVLLVFFATYCNFSVQQFSHLKILHEEFGENLTIVSISPENESVLRGFREDHDIAWMIAEDTANVFDMYNVSGIPTLVIIDRQGYICYTHVGLTEESLLRSEIQGLLPKTIYVDDDNVTGPWNGTLEHPYQNITSGLDDASANDTIFVYAGTYYENVIVDKSLTLVGESEESTIVDGNRTGTVIKVIANNIAISGFTVQNSNSTPGTSYSGIKISGRACNVTGNYVTRNKIGIFVTSQESRIAGNIVTKNGHGISLYDSSEVTVEANNVSANTVGISLALSSHNMIVGNRVENSSTGGHGITLSSDSFNNTILNNDLISNYHGIWLSSSFNNSILENTIANNELLGIELATSPNNTFYHNTFFNNPKHVVIGNQTNTWDDGYPSGGNYWSDYNGTDVYNGQHQNETGSDGIGDTAYVIDAANRDSYPLTKPYGGLYDIGITNITTSKTVVGQGYNLNVTIKMINYGVNTEAFNVTAYVNTTVIQTRTVALASRNSAIIAFTWNTTGWTRGYYTISAYATPVVGEIDTSDNIFTYGQVRVVTPGNVNGDETVDEQDIFTELIPRFMCETGDSCYSANSDINGDNIINMKDIYTAIIHFMETEPQTNLSMQLHRMFSPAG